MRGGAKKQSGQKKKENIFRVPACRVSVRFGRKCVGYFGAVTWAGGLREAPGQSQPRARAPPRTPHCREPLTLRRRIPATARRRDLGAPRPPFPLPPLQQLQPSPLNLTQYVGGNLCRWPEGLLETQWAGQEGRARSLPGWGSGHGRGLWLKTSPAHCRPQGIQPPSPQLPWPPIRNDSLQLVPWGLDLATQGLASPLPSQGLSGGLHLSRC
ncbi:PREDICTED: uncharacterized protein LOC101380803 [Odobenus rosmarus divergens]|uniref:Uncharacterized protein LOC101380803 n=1 Tax=Odobenus rosmarus divergens TaxID=9708 RepID=A0A9B0GW92_ODORO